MGVVLNKHLSQEAIPVIEDILTYDASKLAEMIQTVQAVGILITQG